MNNDNNDKVFPDKSTIDTVLNLLEEKARLWNCSLEEAFERFLIEKIQDVN